MKHSVVWWLEICAYSSVDLFALLSGWLGIEKKRYSCYRVIELIAVVAIYCVAVTAIFFVADASVFENAKDVIKSLVPSLAGRYWYITCYIPLGFLQPFINKMLLSLSVQNHGKLCTACVVLFSLLPSITNIDLFAFANGYSFGWLVVCYTIGAYLKRDRNEKCQIGRRKGTYVAIFAICSVILTAGQTAYNAVFHEDTQYMISYCSPFILLMSIALIQFAAQTEVKTGRNLFARLSSVAFDVYVIHCHILIYDRVICDHFQWIPNLPVLLIPITVVCLVAVLYIALGIIGMCRCALFEKLQLNDLLKKFSAVIDEKFIPSEQC